MTLKNVLVTGANGFIGKNLVSRLELLEGITVFKYDRENTVEELNRFIKQSDFVFHLAGVNRPSDVKEFEEGNKNFTEDIIDLIKKSNKNIPLLITSSIQADLDNPYGVSKKQAEIAAFNYSQETCSNSYVYRLPNVFGKWCRPNYNSAVATFCHNVAHDLPITVNDSNVVLNLVYIDDVVEEFINAMNGHGNKVDEFYQIPTVHTIKLGEIVDLIYSFKKSRDERSIPNMEDAITKKIYSTYLSYLPEDEFSYELKMNVDHRGSFTEFIKTPERGQVSVNISKPGITKGNHWHHTKNEKFLVVSGRGVIRFRKPDSDNVIEYFVSGDKLEVVDIPTGYTHNIENLGETDMVTIMWANEPFDPQRPDTYFLEV